MMFYFGLTPVYKSSIVATLIQRQ